jgi:hypothetical protein
MAWASASFKLPSIELVTLFTKPEKKLPRAPRGSDAGEDVVELDPEADVVAFGNIPKGSSGFAGSAALFALAAVVVVGVNWMIFWPSCEVFSYVESAWNQRRKTSEEEEEPYC